MRPGDCFTVRIEKAVAGGRMLARHEGAVVLVSAAIPGEIVEVEIESVRRGTAWAATRRVLEPSADRVEPFCDWTCGGSVYAHVRYDRQLDLKREVIRDAFAHLARLSVDPGVAVVASRPEGYRMRARLHFRQGRVGFFREGTHDVCDAAATRQLLPATVDVLKALEERLSGAPRVAIDEIAISENRDATDRVVHLDLAADSDPSRLAALTAVETVTGVSCAVGANRRPLTLSGSPVVTDTIDGVRLTRHAGAFFQGNRYLLSELVRRVSSAVPPGRVADLYAGVGLFSTTLAARGDTDVVAVEGDSVAAADLKHNAAPFRGVLSARHQAVEQFLATRHRQLRGATVVVDPPRTGLSKDALEGVFQHEPHTIVYVSCDVATLARDVRLAADRGYRLRTLEAFDMFPHTAHVELLAVLQTNALGQ